MIAMLSLWQTRWRLMTVATYTDKVIWHLSALLVRSRAVFDPHACASCDHQYARMYLRDSMAGADELPRGCVPISCARHNTMRGSSVRSDSHMTPATSRSSDVLLGSVISGRHLISSRLFVHTRMSLLGHLGTEVLQMVVWCFQRNATNCQ